MDGGRELLPVRGMRSQVSPPKEDDVMASMQSLKPARKVWIGSLVGATTTLVLWLVETIGKTTVPSTIAVSISTILSFVVSYLVPPSDNDGVVT
jgi:hypothetical protein